MVSFPQEQLEAARRGNVQAFRALVEAHQRFVYAVAFRMVRNEQDAEDIAQDVFVRLWKHLGTFRPDVKLTTWLYKIVVNRSLDFLKSVHGRQRKQAVDASEHIALPAEGDPDRALRQQELNTQVQAAADTLAPLQKAVFVLRDLEGLSTEETALALEMSTGNVKSNLFHARQKVMSYLKEVYQTRERDFL